MSHRSVSVESLPTLLADSLAAWVPMFSQLFFLFFRTKELAIYIAYHEFNR